MSLIRNTVVHCCRIHLFGAITWRLKNASNGILGSN